MKDWCDSRRLQLNSSKTEIIWFASKTNHAKLKHHELSLRLNGSVVEPATVVKDLGAYLDQELNLRIHVAKISASCYFHLRRLRQLRYIATSSTMQTLVSSIILTRLDYCNALLAGLPKSTLAPLTRILHAAIRLVANLPYDGSVSKALRERHWLPVDYRIGYKLCLMMHAVVHGRAPSYICDLVVPLATMKNRERLRSHSSGDYDVPRVRTLFGSRAFSVAGPVAWNQLPTNLRTVAPVENFKSKLKTYLFEIAYNCHPKSH